METLKFSDITHLEVNIENPLPVKDVLAKDATGTSFDRTNSHLISKNQLLGNDIDYQGDILTITALSDVTGGTASITAQVPAMFASYVETGFRLAAPTWLCAARWNSVRISYSPRRRSIVA